MFFVPVCLRTVLWSVYEDAGEVSRAPVLCSEPFFFFAFRTPWKSLRHINKPFPLNSRQQVKPLFQTWCFTRRGRKKKRTTRRFPLDKCQRRREGSERREGEKRGVIASLWASKLLKSLSHRFMPAEHSGRHYGIAETHAHAAPTPILFELAGSKKEPGQDWQV